MRVAVVGASGFLGSACAAEAKRLGLDVDAVKAPRLTYDGSLAAARLMDAAGEAAATFSDTLLDILRGADVVINAAGAANAVSRDRGALLGANTLLPISLALILSHGSAHLLHISSAAVQGDMAVLDETARTQPFSPYSESKAAAEAVLASFRATTSYRPTSVHGRSRQVTRTLAKFARSPLSSVAGHGQWPTPQVLVENVASGILHVAQTPRPPQTVLHPSEQLTCVELLHMLGDRRPRQVPIAAARTVVGLGKKSTRGTPFARRLELLWLGQDQKRGWLDKERWEPPVGREAWGLLGRAFREETKGVGR